MVRAGGHHATVIGAVTERASCTKLGNQRLFMRFLRFRHFRAGGVSCTSLLLNLPIEILLLLISMLKEERGTLMNILVVNAHLHSTTFLHIQETLQSIHWAAECSVSTCVATELALCVCHFMVRFHMHSFSAASQYTAIKQAILAKHNRNGILHNYTTTATDGDEQNTKTTEGVHQGGRIVSPDGNVQIRFSAQGTMSVLVDMIPVLVTPCKSAQKHVFVCWQDDKIVVLSRRANSVSRRHCFSSSSEDGGLIGQRYGVVAGTSRVDHTAATV